MALRLKRLMMPSCGLPLRHRRVRLLALLAARDEMRFLPGFVVNVGPQVDGIVALDDGSSDASAEFLALRPEVLEVLRVPPERPAWDEVGNHRALVAAGIRYGADWLVSLDADERVERDFRSRVERVIRRGRPLRISGYALRLRELWDSPDHYRVDGIWARKAPARLFAARADHEFDTRALHAYKAPLQARSNGRWRVADINIYHLRMLHEEDRLARRRRYEAADPEARLQPDYGYGYLTDTTGMRLERIRAWRHYRS